MITQDSSIKEDSSEIRVRALGIAESTPPSRSQGLGLEQLLNLWPTSPQFIQALALRRLLNPSAKSRLLALFQES